jgi:hypothetical protein
MIAEGAGRLVNLKTTRVKKGVALIPKTSLYCKPLNDYWTGIHKVPFPSQKTVDSRGSKRDVVLADQ